MNLFLLYAIQGSENRVGESLINVVRRKEGFMNELDLDYVIIKLKKKSPRRRDEEQS